MKNTEEIIYYGIHTFMAAPFISLNEIGNYDVAVLGEPLDYGASFRQGARFAPADIRKYSFWDRVDGTSFVEFETGKQFISNKLKIADLGDINVWPGDGNKNIKEMVKTVKSIRQKTFPLILGGDHSVTYANYLGCYEALGGNLEEWGVIHFDAHADVEDNYLNFPEIWHGNFFRKLIEKKVLLGKNMVSIGLRDIVPKIWWDYIQKNGINVITASDFNKTDVVDIVKRISKYLLPRCSKIFITLDIDSIDGSSAPGAGTPKPGGLKAEKLISLMRHLDKFPIKGMDLVEVSPEVDPSGNTSFLACDILFNFLSFGLKL